jgi:hypothetical protein
MAYSTGFVIAKSVTTARIMAALGLLSFLFGCRADSPYHTKDGAWYWKDDRIDLPSSATLTPLNGSFAVANGRGYFRADPIDDSDGATFQALDGTYAKDARHVWYCDTYRKSQEYWLVKRTRATAMAGADPATFRLLTQRYTRDASQIYFEGEAFAVRDPATFEVLYSSYARDRVAGYYMREPVPQSDGASFEGLSDHFARDKTHVWYSHINLSGPGAGVVENVLLPDADPATFTAIEGDFGKDARRVYQRAAVVKDANPQTFTVPR